MNLPTDVCQEALDSAGVDYTLGDIEDGTREAQVILRKYQQCLMQLLRGAHWEFARKTTPLVLLADATGLTANVGTQVPMPWIYEYAYPNDCMKVRYIPQNWYATNPAVPNTNIVPSDSPAPLMTGLGQPPYAGARIIPGRYVVATDSNNLGPAGTPAGTVQGVGFMSRTVILTNIQSANIVYTALMLEPTLWDPMFRAALVAYLASEVAVPLAKDKKTGLIIQERQVALTKEKLLTARARDGNEGWFSSDIAVDWMRGRTVGGAYGPWGPAGGGWAGGPGGGEGWGGYDTVGFSNGSAY